MNSNTFRAPAFGSLIVGIALVSAVSDAQIVRAPLVQPQVAVPLRRINPSFPLANKRVFDEAKLRPFITFHPDGTILKLRGEEFRLLPPDDGKTRALTRSVVPLPLKMTRYNDRIIKWRSGYIPPIDTGIVDHRALQSPIKSQGGRGTCSAFATVAGVEALNKRKGQPWGDFSENDAFNGALTLTGGHCTQSGGVHTWATTQVALTGVCPEAAFPYTPQCPAASIPQACQVAPHAKLDHVFMMQTPAHLVPGLPNDAAHRADNVALLESWIHSGADIIYAVDVAGNDWNNGDLNTAVVDVQVDSQGHPAPAYGAHAILMVGYDHNAKYFIFKNSWGTGLGHNGYIYLSYDYVQTYAWYGFVIID